MLKISFLSETRYIPSSIVVGAVSAIVLSLLTPNEATLGPSIKLVFLHGASIWVALILLTISGVCGLGYLFSHSESLIEWSRGSLIASMILMAITGVLALVSAYIAWGGMYWREPRFVALVEMLAFGSLIIAVGILSGSKLFTGAINLFYMAAAWFLLNRAGLVMHPKDPIFTSSSTVMKVFPILITISLFFASIQFVRYLTMGNHTITYLRQSRRLERCEPLKERGALSRHTGNQRTESKLGGTRLE